MPPPPPPYDPNYEVLEFEVTNEVWNEYEFADGASAKGRLILYRVSHRRGQPRGIYDISSQNIFTVATSPDHRGNPSPLTPQELSGQVPVPRTPVRVTNSNEGWNEYRLVRGDETIRLKMLVSDVYRVTGRYDAFGEPAYIIISGVVVSSPQDKRGRIPQ